MLFRKSCYHFITIKLANYFSRHNQLALEQHRFMFHLKYDCIYWIEK